MDISPDLDSLSRPAADAPRVRRVPSWLVPAAILGGFALLFLALFRDRLIPAPSVDVAVVLATAGETVSAEAPTGAAPGKMLFQASGWLEPDPLPIKATALVDGVVDEVHVLEGEAVTRGQLLATLVADDARLALDAAERNVQTKESALEAHCAEIVTLNQRLAGARAEMEAAQALEDEADDLFRRLSDLPAGTMSEVEVVAARLRLAREKARRGVAESRIGEIEAELAQLELGTLVMEDEIAEADVMADQARLALERTRIFAPVDGRVLRLHAAPGEKRMLGMEGSDSSTIAILYQPDRLQVRVDVPLADAAGLQVGQQARIRCSVLPDKVFHGEVTRITGEADLQRNTLQAKVRVLDPVDVLRPEMLCRVEFLGTARIDESGEISTLASLAAWVPEAAVADGAVWVCDPETERVSRRQVRAADEVRDGYRRILDGLRPGEWVVLSPADLDEGQRVNPNLKQS